MKTEDQSVHGEFEQSVGIVVYAGLSGGGQAGEPVGGECLLGAGVLIFIATHFAARRSAGFGERMADHKAPEAVESIGGLLLAESGVDQDGRDRFDEFESSLGDQRARTEQRDGLSVGQEGCAGSSSDGPQVVVPAAGARWQLDL